jgi:hypothetical protein
LIVGRGVRVGIYRNDSVAELASDGVPEILGMHRFKDIIYKYDSIGVSISVFFSYHGFGGFVSSFHDSGTIIRRVTETVPPDAEGVMVLKNTSMRSLTEILWKREVSFKFQCDS